MSFLTPTHLKTVCTPVAPGDYEYPETILKMQMSLAHGIGIAANQVGETKRIIIVHTKDFKQVFINPEITRKYGGTHNSREDCLSFPGRAVLVIRSKQIEVVGRSPEGKKLKFKLKGLAAAVVQHEVDHLDGITCIDKASKILI